jgi:exodeoxyribonuclease VII large subunit
MPEFSVSEISQALKRVVEGNFSHVRIRGEITGWKLAASGHAYLGLKDAEARLDAVCWKGSLSKFAFKPEDGLEIIATGKLTTYPGRSNYQMVIEWMEPAGAGALMALLEKRKAALAAEGLFDPARKKNLPFLPEVIGVVTSPTGAVIRDILHRLADRFPRPVLLWPVLVQGEGAAAQIAAAIHGFNHPPADASWPKPDLLIVARGGGSIEDLWPFNEEVVVRAAAASQIPLISAVGHETDTTLIDFAADKRAPTPTAAAEMAVPVRADLVYTLRDSQQRMDTAIRQSQQQILHRLEGLARGLPKPMELLSNATQRLDNWTERLQASLLTSLQKKQQRYETIAAGLRPTALWQDLQRKQEATEKLSRSLRRIDVVLDRKQQQLNSLEKQLHLLDYHQVLKRGFALVKDAHTGKLLTQKKMAEQATALEILFDDGTLRASPPPKQYMLEV